MGRSRLAELLWTMHYSFNFSLAVNSQWKLIITRNKLQRKYLRKTLAEHDDYLLSLVSIGFVWIQLPVLLADCPAPTPVSIEGKPYVCFCIEKIKSSLPETFDPDVKICLLQIPRSWGYLVS